MTSEQRTLVDGSAAGLVMRLDEPLSFWGGIDPTSGVVIDTRHPQLGERLTGSILVMSYGRGSSSSSQVLTEALRLGSGPAGIIIEEPDQIVALGAFVAGLLYGIWCPVVVANGALYAGLRTGEKVEIQAGRLRLVDH